MRIGLSCLGAVAAIFLTAAAHGEDVTGYARACAARITAVPAFDCAAGVELPISVGGKVPASYAPGMSCDRPSLTPPLAGEATDGPCVPQSRLLTLHDDATAQITAICRQKILRPSGTRLYDEIDVILHSPATGSTCWFHAEAPAPRAAGRGLDGHVPAPEDGDAARRFWSPPAETAKRACVSCHDGSPFLYSPFVAQARILPADPFGPYANDVGADFQSWPAPQSIATRGNTCTACHRIGSMESCRVLMLQSVGKAPTDGLDDWGKLFPQSHWMPPGDLHSAAQWAAIYDGSVAALSRCCARPETPGCVLAPMPKAP